MELNLGLRRKVSPQKAVRFPKNQFYDLQGKLLEEFRSPQKEEEAKEVGKWEDSEGGKQIFRLTPRAAALFLTF